MSKKKYYAVALGRKTGIYFSWFGVEGAHAQINKFNGAIYKGFSSIEEARRFIKKSKPVNNYNQNINNHKKNISSNIKIYTDGCSLGNPGPGGYGVVIIQDQKQKKISGGFKYTTNNRMELMACIIGLSKIKNKSNIDLFSDSKYVIYGICKGWAIKWKKNNWMKNNNEKAKNKDLWEKLLKICSNHKINFKWVKGHDGNSNNEKCDFLANKAALSKNLDIDIDYEKSLLQKDKI